ncbi:hypothetical protein LT85_3008 [Collimonas arenae]|uniref:EF-hand domain-containing protein n=1 Tax=Collimonas arenae TaxID=279058 RepID=A0A0A1FCC9_9BURK|nr:EF-hand domain-containing protein [Collimonas arenae]AIY42166.1 hypothetical protein LT85_3008 [Collimonas arenae]
MKRFLIFSALAMPMLAAALPALAQAPAADMQSATTSRQGMAQLGDPYVPPRVKAAARAAALGPSTTTTGVSVQDRALKKLQTKFNEADTDGTGSVTKSQAQKAGFGFVANNFEQIDVGHAGRVTFENVKSFMRSNGAAF